MKILPRIIYLVVGFQVGFGEESLPSHTRLVHWANNSVDGWRTNEVQAPFDGKNVAIGNSASLAVTTGKQIDLNGELQGRVAPGVEYIYATGKVGEVMVVVGSTEQGKMVFLKKDREDNWVFVLDISMYFKGACGRFVVDNDGISFAALDHIHTISLSGKVTTWPITTPDPTCSVAKNGHNIYYVDRTDGDIKEFDTDMLTSRVVYESNPPHSNLFLAGMCNNVLFLLKDRVTMALSTVDDDKSFLQFDFVFDQVIASDSEMRIPGEFLVDCKDFARGPAASVESSKWLKDCKKSCVLIRHDPDSGQTFFLSEDGKVIKAFKGQVVGFTDTTPPAERGRDGDE